MSALPAEELTCGSDIRPPRALRPVPASDDAPFGPGAAAPSGAGGDTPAVPDATRRGPGATRRARDPFAGVRRPPRRYG